MGVLHTREARAVERGVFLRLRQRPLTSIDPAIDLIVVIIGGGVSRAGEVLIGPLRQQLGAMLPLRAALLPSLLGVDAQLHGAVFAVLQLGDAFLVEQTRAAGA